MDDTAALQWDQSPLHQKALYPEPVYYAQAPDGHTEYRVYEVRPRADAVGTWRMLVFDPTADRIILGENHPDRAAAMAAAESHANSSKS